ncbi:methyltransferase [Brachybacterium ginsengisoli]|uniref:Methyltransferase n=1 Tax=Brachybacterium ginsengisoli TaxID=1331682 RepID=A0A291H0C2_9MICO|nr:class I SAM-dependent methyltransferase [Brachybacterium ginsengisoli]ATG55919.1 methyltransferase [Brachybacterium ginsengisoli]
MSTISWSEHGEMHSARWHSENGAPAPTRIEVVDDTLTADIALRRRRAGSTLLWRGDYPGARQLLSALGRRIDKRSAPREDDIARLFRAHRAQRAERARLLGGLVVLLEPGHRLELRRAPEVADACREAYGSWEEPTLVSLSELLGVLSAHQWQQKGVPIPALDGRIHARYGVFSPVRSEYVDLVAEAPLPPTEGHLTVFDLGTGTGVLAAVLARRGATQVTATDINPRAVACAQDNVRRLGLEDRVTVVETDLFPPGRADLVVCNPPWLPGAATSALELGVYDDSSAMLRGFLDGLADHLRSGGEGWLVLSDLAEHLRLRGAGELEGLIAAAGLEVIGRLSTSARHPRATDPRDLLHAARSQESTVLWRLRAAVC